MASKSRLKELYNSKIKIELQKTLELKNIMEVPKVEKIVLNIGVKEAVADSKVLNGVLDIFSKISSQKPVKTVAKKSIAGFKIREGMPLGVRVTLRDANMYSFLDKLINLSLPTVRDFQGVPVKLDGNGNYNLGIKDWTIFPELDFDSFNKIHGFNITIQTSAKKDAHGFELLKLFGMPFKKKSENKSKGA